MIPSPLSIRALPRRHFLARSLAFLAGTALFSRARRSEADVQGIDPYVAEIRLFAGAFAPNGWALCNGQLLPIAQWQALFSLIGTTYGGNGQNNFALPDLRGRVAIHFGQGPGLSNRFLGGNSGSASHIVSVAEMPIHTHIARGSAAIGGSTSPAGMVPARNAAQIPQYGTAVDTPMPPVSLVGGSQPHENRQPFLALNYIIALQGIFPSQ